MRAEIKQLLHSTHSGIDACLRRARECIYWPGMTSDIKQMISTCEICQTYQPANQRETLQSHDTPSRQWEKVGVDLFEMDGKDYLVTVDYLSNFWEVDRLENTKSSTVIRKLKAHFARYGSPCTVISDNGPQFTSSNFEEFAKLFDFEHITSSPYHSKSNGKAESAVKTAKTLLRKNKDGDQFLALLNHRNTPSQGSSTSPAQKFFNRRTRTLLPMCNKLLRPQLNLESDIRELNKQKLKQKVCHDKNAKDLKQLHEGDTVVMKPHTLNKKEWTRGTVVNKRSSRSYEIQTDDGAVSRRNRVHLRRAEPQATSECPEAAEQPAPQPASSPKQVKVQKQVLSSPKPAVQKQTFPVPEVTETQAPAPIVTRSGRVSKRNQLEDFKY